MQHQMAKRPLFFVCIFAPVIAFSVDVFAGQGNGTSYNYLTFANQHDPELTLETENGRCIVSIGDAGSSVPLGVQGPCGFVRSGDEPVPRSFFYEEVGRVYIIAGPVVEDAAYNSDTNTHKAKREHECSHHGQAIVVSGREIQPRPAEMREFAFCHENAPDEKVYYHYARSVDSVED